MLELDLMGFVSDFGLDLTTIGAALFGRGAWSWRDYQKLLREKRKPGPKPAVLPPGVPVPPDTTKNPEMVKAHARKRLLTRDNPPEAVDTVAWDELRWGYKDEPGQF